jgi:hypothetical protein
MKTTLATLLTITALAASAADSQQLIPFQGRLTDQSGTPYTEGFYTVVFSLYDAPVGGTALWTERHASVGLVNGMVNVFLGSITDLSGQDFTKTRYLGITIDADGNANTPDPEMVPRQMIIPAFFAKDSEKLMGADWSAILANGSTDPRTGYIAGARIAEKTITTDKLADDAVTTDKVKDAAVTAGKIAEDSITPAHLSAAAMNDLASKFLPPGVIMPYAGPVANVPSGWLLCDGHAVPSTQYPALFAAIGTIWGSETNITENGVTYFKLPNFQNRTLWGADQKALGTYVAPGLPNIVGNANSMYCSGGPSGSFYYGGGGSTRHEGSSHTHAGNYMSFDASRSSSIYGASDTVQPPAAAVNFIIKCDPTF